MIAVGDAPRSGPSYLWSGRPSVAPAQGMVADTEPAVLTVALGRTPIQSVPGPKALR
jgi:hypothetical protein